MCETYGYREADRLFESVEKCIERERLYDSIYHQVYWLLFIRSYTPQEVAKFFESRLSYFESSKAVKPSKHSSVVAGILRTEWTKE